VHFPNEDWCDSAWFDQLTSETCETYSNKQGKSLRRWNLRKGRHNEVLDTANYCLAARQSEPFKDGMLAAPKTIYVNEAGEQIIRGKVVKPTTEFDIDKPESSFVTPVKKRKKRHYASSGSGVFQNGKELPMYHLF
jgi:phage terminase large subunit GpA-like protein